MRSGLIIFICTFSFSLLNTGCSSILNPYSSDFSCPKAENGKCIDIETAHEESLAKTNRKNSETPKQAGEGKDCNRTGKTTKTGSDDDPIVPGIAYQDELHKKLAGLLAQPITPVIAPPTVMRVLMLPYQGDENELYMQRYVYIMVDGPKWVMGDYLSKDKDGK
jgi:conjugal transfer pilus assembly protein TraV